MLLPSKLGSLSFNEKYELPFLDVLARLMLAEGVTREIIAQALRVSRSTLLNYLKPYGTGSHPKMRRANQEPSSGRGS
jgi:hypothetical protein